ILRRQAIQAVGLFDERFFIYCEDIDLSYRFQRAGWRRYFVPQAELFHYGGQGTSQIKIRSYWRHVTSFIKLFHKYGWHLDEVFRTSLTRSDPEVDLCITIVNFNSHILLDRCLSSIFRHPPQCRFKVVVVDNGSGDSSLELARDRYPQVDWVANRNNLGYARAVSQAFRLVRAGNFLLLNPDVELLEDSADQLVGFMRDHPEAGIAGAKLFYPTGGLQPSARRFYTLGSLLWRRTALGKLFPNARINREHLMADWDHNSVRLVDWLLGTSMMVRRAAVNDVGLMDERFFLYFEDVDWCYRFRRAGWSVCYVPQARMIHQHLRESAHRGLSRSKLEHLKSLIRFVAKYRGLVRAPDTPLRTAGPPAGTLNGLRIAIVHDYLTQYGGAERVLEVLHRMFPRAVIHTLVKRRHFGRTTGSLIPVDAVRTSFIQRMPGSSWGEFREYLGLLPMAIERFDFSGFDIVISNSSAWAKGAITDPHTLHICYLLSPMRFIWTWHEKTLRECPRPVRAVLRRLLRRIKDWDIMSSRRPDIIVTISREVQNRIRNFYGREASVVNPGIDCSFFTPDPAAKREDYYLVASRLKPYKRIDVMIDAFNKNGKRLMVIGDGSEGRRLRWMARGNIRFLGRVSDAVLREHYRRCRAFVFPTNEDFGLTPLEAMSCGTPVIAYGKGGARETVEDGTTGIFFEPQTPEALNLAVERFESMSFAPSRIREHATQFDEEVFMRNFKALVQREYDRFMTQ
ncbi:MAG: glycosyltransferase, partial [Candidatus Edwardsbacteria bacterium]|nr:glycosyltransferase [Candidatus Edwardsbacteria bacterium]